MKNLFIIAAVLVAFGATSCKKDYTCDCTYDLLGVSQTISYDLGKQSKKDAEAACDVYSVTGFTCSAKS